MDFAALARNSLLSLSITLFSLTPASAATPPLPDECIGIEEDTVLTVKPSVFKDTDDVAGSDYDKWGIGGQFTQFTSFVFDPVNYPVTLILNQDVVLYEVTVPPGTFESSGSPGAPKWKFRLRDTAPDIVGAEGWRMGRFRAVPSRQGPLNRMPLRLSGRGVPIPIDLNYTADGAPEIPVLRATLRFHDADGNPLCATTQLACIRRHADKMLRCFSFVP